MGAPAYSFTLSRWYAEVPLSLVGGTDTVIDLAAPWPAILGFGACVAYVALVLLWPRERKPVCGSNALHGTLHYAALFAYSLFVCAATFYHVWQAGELTDLTRASCVPIPGWLRLISLSFTVSKIWEWGDTLVLLERGDSLSKIGTLHLYHHCTTFLLFLVTPNFAGAEKTGLLLNGFVHTLMYAHFSWRLPKPLRPIITFAQIVQLAFGTWMWHIAPSMCPAYAPFPAAYPIEFIIPYVLVPVYLAFFIKFFFETYVCPKRTRGGAKAGGKKSADSGSKDE